MKKRLLIIPAFLIALVFTSCSKDKHIIGGDRNETNAVNMSTFDFLKSFEATTQTARLIERAGLVNEVNGDVTVIAPSNFAVNRFLRRKNNRLLRLDPASQAMTVEDIPRALHTCIRDLHGCCCCDRLGVMNSYRNIS